MIKPLVLIAVVINILFTDRSEAQSSLRADLIWEEFAQAPSPRHARLAAQLLRDTHLPLESQAKDNLETSVATQFRALKQGLTTKNPDYYTLAFRLRSLLEGPIRRDLDAELAELIQSNPRQFLIFLKTYGPVTRLDELLTEVTPASLRLYGSKGIVLKLRKNELSKIEDETPTT
jgi:hypothetical protein